jgi:hypothetical protein
MGFSNRNGQIARPDQGAGQGSEAAEQAGAAAYENRFTFQRLIPSRQNAPVVPGLQGFGGQDAALAHQSALPGFVLVAVADEYPHPAPFSARFERQG